MCIFRYCRLVKVRQYWKLTKFYFNKFVLKKRIPDSITLALTYKCNQDCQHCYMNHQDDVEMDTETIKMIIDQIADVGNLDYTYR